MNLPNALAMTFIKHEAGDSRTGWPWMLVCVF